jgi:uncharacterized phiE125 gp8 family phage protein/SPP1 family predicted phage head-tail adaptor
MPSFTLTVPPAAEPVALADVKLHARIDTTADDSLVTNLITGARQWAEQYTGRAIINQTWQMALDFWPGATEAWWDGVREGPVTGLDRISFISLPRPPLASVTSVQYFDNTDTPATWDPGNYFVDTLRQPGRLALRLGATWPVPSRLTNGIVITYVAGYGSDGTTVPEPIKTAIRQLVTHWYEHRGEASQATGSRGMASAFNAVNDTGAPGFLPRPQLYLGAQVPRRKLRRSGAAQEIEALRCRAGWPPQRRQSSLRSSKLSTSLFGDFMTSGALRKRVTFQTETPTTDNAGGYALAWTNVITVWADIKPSSGNKYFVDGHLEGHITHHVTIRYQTGITTDMRMVYSSRLFNIRAVLNADESNQWLELLVEEGTVL